MAKGITSEHSINAAQSADGAVSAKESWSHRMSNHIAYALLVYTGLQIFVVMAEMKGDSHSMLPYLGLVILIALVIPACRRFEKRWEHVDANTGEEQQSEVSSLFLRDCTALWLCAIGLPLAIAGLWHLGTMAIG
ncbi:hypothetical protein [Alterisphingorhabdus coralli]|uniref:Uncharacterized protein n=1 Tax=Alterisphingorhabdus coralli TaxID=3071408 RepID=A0AA97F6D8_9SPHN|nr:hypothetical protein [Parasphingorhabdus sp. SCSIO 66989]WOE75239.1 hypothetical protein RB602_00535 [Parasphingorhabdus sp. SCSIO 66989]